MNATTTSLRVTVNANVGEDTDNRLMTEDDVDRLTDTLSQVLAGEGWNGSITLTVA